MKVIKQVKQYQLYKDEFTGMYSVSDNDNVSLWFDVYTKDELIMLNDNEFIFECKEILGDD